MSANLIDFHCHLDLFPDFVSAINEAERSGIYTLTVTTTPKAWPRNNELTRSTRYVRAGLGLHPQVVGERAEEIELWEKYLPETRYVGEVGIDAGPSYYKSLSTQQQVFQRVLQCCASAGGKILTVHSVRSAKLVMDMIEANLPPNRGRVVLHWFTGSKSEARRGIELGCYFSINSMMLETERGRELVTTLPNDRLLTETDAPFTRVEGRTSKPQDVSVTVLTLAEILQRSPETVTGILKTNLRRLLGSDL